MTGENMEPLFESGSVTVSAGETKLVKIENEFEYNWYIEEVWVTQNSDCDYYWYINGEEYYGNSIKFESIGNNPAIVTLLNVYLKIVNNGTETVKIKYYIRGLKEKR